MSMSGETLALIVLVVLVLGSFPVWPYASSWGYGPSGILMLVLVIFLIWAIAGERPLFRNSPASSTTRTIKSTGQDVGHDLKATGRDVGHDLKAAGRNAADSIRNTLQ